MRPKSCIVCEVPNVPTALSEPYAFVAPYCTFESAWTFVCQVIRAVLVLTDAVSVFDTASAEADDVEVVVDSVVVAVVSVASVGEVVVAACGELVESVEVEVGVSVGGGVGSGLGSGVASVVNVSSGVMAALPEESITMTR